MDTELLDQENRWAVYPIEKIEAAVKNLSEAIAEARSKVRAEQSGEDELNKILCPGCHDGLYKDGGWHVYMDGDTLEQCYATEQRKQALREYFAAESFNAKNHVVPGRFDNPSSL